MPRKDGLHTNFEIASELEAVGRDVFAEAWKREFSDGVMPAFEGKPLSNIALKVYTVNAHSPRGETGAITSEDLFLQPASMLWEEHPRWQSNPEDLETRNTLAESIGNTLCQDFVPDLATTGSIVATYRAHRREQSPRVQCSDAERPTKALLISARELGQTALEYIAGPRFNMNINERLSELGDLGTGRQASDLTMRHRWEFRPTVDMPINGKEGDRFLSNHYEFLSEKISHCRRDLERGMMLPFLEEATNQRLAIAETNIAQVQRHLFGCEG